MLESLVSLKKPITLAFQTSTMTITTQVTHTETREVEIPVPSFWKERIEVFKCYRAVLDENTFFEILEFPDEIIIRTSEIKENDSRVLEAHAKFDIISEEDFFAAYNRIYESLRLTPALKVDANY